MVQTPLTRIFQFHKGTIKTGVGEGFQASPVISIP